MAIRQPQTSPRRELRRLHRPPRLQHPDPLRRPAPVRLPPRRHRRRRTLRRANVVITNTGPIHALDRITRITPNRNSYKLSRFNGLLAPRSAGTARRRRVARTARRKRAWLMPGCADSLAAIVQWALSGSLGSRVTDGRGLWVWEFREWLPGLADRWRSPESLVVAASAAGTAIAVGATRGGPHRSG